METQKIRLKSDYKLADIIHDIERGILRIPQFQREFVWDKPKVIKLLESIYLEYPIGSFFFWDAPHEYHNFYRDIAELNLPKPEKYDKIIFILDGQQRLTSLYTTVKGLELYGRNYGEICFDLDDHKFVDHKPDNKRFISFRDLLADDKEDIYDNLSPEQRSVYRECRQRFINYPFSAIDVRDKDLDEVCDIFERINQGGQRLNLFDLIAASTWSTDFDLRVAVKKENEVYESKGYGEIDNEIFVQTLALIAKGSCTRSSQLQLRENDIKTYWKETLESLRLAVDWSKHEFGAVTSVFLPYKSMLAVIAYLFFKVKGRSLSNEQIATVSRWFWQTAFSERYGGSTLTLMTEDRKVMDKIAEGKEVSIRYAFSLDIESLIKVRMFRKSAIKNAVLCLLALRHPKHFRNNTPIALDDSYYSDFNNIERHHIFPKSIVQKKFNITMVHSLPNFCFIPAELNKEISNKLPSNYFADISSSNPEFTDTLKTHLIHYDDSIKNNDYMSFLASRSALILEEITKVTGSKVSALIIDDANKAIDKTEIALRDLIDNVLSSKDENYWKACIPSDVVMTSSQKIDQAIKKDPTKDFNSMTNRERLDYCDVMDYPKIILSNWEEFSKYFRSKGDVTKRFISFKEYRNPVKHNREEIPSFLKKEGEAALEWLTIILKEAIPNSKNEEAIYDLEHHFSRVPANLVSIFKKLRTDILALDTRIKEKPVKYYIGYKIKYHNFCAVSFSQNNLRIYLRTKSLEDPKKLATNQIRKDKQSTIWYFDVQDLNEIDYTMSLIKQSYETAPDNK